MSWEDLRRSLPSAADMPKFLHPRGNSHGIYVPPPGLKSLTCKTPRPGTDDGNGPFIPLHSCQAWRFRRQAWSVPSNPLVSKSQPI